MTQRKMISSNPTFIAGLRWTIIVGLGVLAIMTLIGVFVDGGTGAASGALGAGIGILFPVITILALLFGNRWWGKPSFLAVFFGVNAGAFAVKVIVLIIALNVVFGLDWVNRLLLYFSIVAAAVSSLVVDVLVFTRMRITYVSDVELPGDGNGEDNE